MKKAVITGASSGLGREIGKLLLKNSVNVVNISRKDSEFQDIITNLENNDDILKAINTIKLQHEDLDLLILNAGIMPQAEIGKINFDVDQTFKINITASIKLVNGLTELLKKNNGDIVIIGSTASFRYFYGDAVYSSTKHAVLGFIKALQDECKKEKIRIIGFHPGAFNSNLRGGMMQDNFMDPKDLAELVITLIKLPKNIQVSEIIIDRKK